MLLLLGMQQGQVRMTTDHEINEDQMVIVGAKSGEVIHHHHRAGNHWDEEWHLIWHVHSHTYVWAWHWVRGVPRHVGIQNCGNLKFRSGKPKMLKFYIGLMHRDHENLIPYPSTSWSSFLQFMNYLWTHMGHKHETLFHVHVKHCTCIIPYAWYRIHLGLHLQSDKPYQWECSVSYL